MTKSQIIRDMAVKSGYKIVEIQLVSSQASIEFRKIMDQIDSGAYYNKQEVAAALGNLFYCVGAEDFLGYPM